VFGYGLPLRRIGGFVPAGLSLRTDLLTDPVRRVLVLVETMIIKNYAYVHARNVHPTSDALVPRDASRLDVSCDSRNVVSFPIGLALVGG
jgi:hypothetical protein